LPALAGPHKRSLVCLLLAAFAFACLAARAPAIAHAGDGDLEWWTIETEHFVINYYSPNEAVARRVAVVAERAHRTLAPALGHTPRDKTQIVLVDDTDGANGFASVLPRNAITLFATPPSSFSVLNDHDDWLYGLVAHEYTHILHLDTIGGIPAWYNRVFGKIWAPNQVQPRWFIEGLATYEESKRSSSGRIRSAIFDMYLRMAVLSGKPLGLDGMSTGPLAWPQGNSVYLYGSHFLDYIADRYGDDKMKAISHEYGHQPVPFGLNRSVSRTVGKDYLALYDEWLEHMREKYDLQRAALEKRGRREGRQITFTGQGNSSPRYTSDDRAIVWAQSDGRTHAAYRVVPSGKDADAAHELVQIDSGGSLSLLPDGTGMVIERGGVWRTSYDYGDLWRWDFGVKKLTRLTYGLRAADPAVSPDGKQIAFTLNGSSRLRLAVMALAPNAPAHVVWEGDWRWNEAFAPAWSPDGQSIAFSAWTRGGYRDIWLYDVASGRAEPLLHDRAIDGDPVWSPDGRWIYFSSDRTGIYNIFAVDARTRELWQVTNVLGGAFTSDVSHDGTHLAYMGYDELGFELFEMPLDRATWLKPELYVDDRPDPIDVRDDETWISAPRRYRPIETLAPNSWTVNLSTDSFGSAATVSTSGSDIVGHHGWGLGATLGLERGDVSFGASYGYNRLWPALRLSVGRSISRPGGLIVDAHNTRYTEELWSGAAGVGLPLLRDQSVNGDLSFSYNLDWLRNVSGVPEPRPDAAATRFPEEGVIAGITTRWTMSSGHRAAFVNGQIDGYSLQTSLRLNHPDLGSDFTSMELGYRWAIFRQMPWAWDQTASLRISGGIETTDRLRDGPYALGGLGTQNIAQSILDNSRASTSVLHGYEPGRLRGRQFHLANLEYRLPLVTIEKGFYTLPIYLRRLHAAVFADAGYARDGDFTWREIRPAVGAALRLDAVFGFYDGGTFELGYARGLADDGVNEWWFLLTGGL
jgi:hypothetical protein